MLRTVVILALVWAFQSAAAAPDPVQVPVTWNLASDARAAAERHLPILLVFAADHCPYCELLEREILDPMLLSGDYRDKVVIRKILLDGTGSLINFNGRKLEAAEFASQRHVFVTPTMLFLDPEGHELAPRLVGINTVEMFAGLVDAAIDQSRSALRAQPAMARSAPDSL